MSHHAEPPRQRIRVCRAYACKSSVAAGGSEARARPCRRGACTSALQRRTCTVRTWPSPARTGFP
eukprot:5699934-Prymnesium_polylepis.1